MNEHQYLKAKRRNKLAGYSVVLFFFAWLPTYLFGILPMLAPWTPRFLNTFPVVLLHVVPIFVPVFCYLTAIDKLFPSPKPPTETSHVI